MKTQTHTQVTTQTQHKIPAIVDCHNHCTRFSPDASQTLDELVQQAQSKGLAGLALTDHYDKDVIQGQVYPNLSTVGSPAAEHEWIFDLDPYFAYIEAKQAQLADEGHDFRLYSGIELGHLPHLVEGYAELIERYPFDVVIGSVHSVEERDIYSYKALYDRPRDEVYTLYLDTLTEMIETLDFDICGHFDYIARYARYDDNRILYANHREALDRFLSALVQHDRCLEINTAGFQSVKDAQRNPAGPPDAAILQRYRELGGSKICLSSDAHHTERVAQHFPEAVAWLKKLGFTAVTYYVQREAHETAI